jgi:hypothetical protein
MEPSKVKQILSFYLFMTPKQRRLFFETATKSQLEAIENACLNLLKNPLGLNEDVVINVRKYREQIRVISSSSESIQDKKRILTQRGAFLSVLLPVLYELVESFAPQ